MDSDLHRHQQQQQQLNSGLARYRSSPNSYFANLINSSYGGEDCDQFLNPRPSTPETERIFARFMSSGGDEDSSPQNLHDIGRNALADEAVQSQFVAPMKHETEVLQPQQQQQIIYQNQSQPDHKATASTSIMDTSYGVGSSIALDGLPQMKMGGGSGGNNSNLIRHSSSPAGLFSHINVRKGYVLTRGVGNFGAGSGTNAEPSFSSASRLKGQIDFSSGPPSSSGLLTRISEIEGKSMEMSSPEDGNFDGHRKDGSYITGFPSSFWDDSAILSNNFLKGLGDNDRKPFSGLNSSENQDGEGRNGTPTVLSHHLSLPTSSAELSGMEKLLHFQDSVPLKIRAKRGCATHPRSIAERVRRTRISERMRKLQELVPNMDKQTSTADMLDLAVDYIKDLQKEVKTLSDIRAKCTCSNKQ